MIPRQPHTAPARTALRLAGLLAVLAGLFGMHGLASHGVSGMESMPPVVIAEASSVSSNAVPADDSISRDSRSDSRRAVVSVLSHADRFDTSTLGPVTPQGLDMNMAGLCIAILVIGLGALLVLAGARPAVSMWWTLTRVSAVTSPTGRDPDPPSLTGLSIQRC